MASGILDLGAVFPTVGWPFTPPGNTPWGILEGKELRLGAEEAAWLKKISELLERRLS